MRCLDLVVVEIATHLRCSISSLQKHSVNGNALTNRHQLARSHGGVILQWVCGVVMVGSFPKVGLCSCRCISIVSSIKGTGQTAPKTIELIPKVWWVGEDKATSAQVALYRTTTVTVAWCSPRPRKT
jgi:hypothetical protein